MIYIGLDNVPVHVIESLGDLLGYDAEYVNVALPYASGYCRIEQFAFSKELARLRTRVRVIAECNLMHSAVVPTPDRTDYTSGTGQHIFDKGVVQNFRNCFQYGVEVIGHWFDKRRALKWTTGATVLPDGGEGRHIWMVEEPRNGIAGWRMLTATQAAVEVGLGNVVALKEVPWQLLPRHRFL